MASRQQEFVNRTYFDARAAGLPDPQARLAAAQAALETGYGKSVAGNNYYGIKAGTAWNGPTVNVGTWEEVDGKRANVRDNFRSYNSPVDSFRDWASMVGSRWSDAMNAPTFSQAVQGLGAGAKGGYATDSRYDDKLNYINETFDPDPQGILSVIDPADLPTPSPAPRASAMGIMSVIDPATPAPVTRQSLPDIKETPVANFDWGRMATPTNPASAAVSFNPDRFGPPAFDASRFGTPEPTAQGLGALQRGLLDQQLEYGILPDIPPPVTEIAPPAPMATPGYVDPRVSAQRPATAPAQIQVQQPVDPRTTAALSRQPQMAAAGQMTAQQARGMQRDMTTRSLLGTVGGAILGGTLLGPVGGLLGGYLGRTVGRDSYYPDAPEPIAGVEQKGSGYNDLSDFGRETYSESGQFRDAVDSGKGGLW
jgi:hypothetical protein